MKAVQSLYNPYIVKFYVSTTVNFPSPNLLAGLPRLLNNDFSYLASHVKFSKSWGADHLCPAPRVLSHLWCYLRLLSSPCGSPPSLGSTFVRNSLFGYPSRQAHQTFRISSPESGIEAAGAESRPLCLCISARGAGCSPRHLSLRLPARRCFPRGRQGPSSLTESCGSRGERRHLPPPALRDRSRLCVRPAWWLWGRTREGGDQVEGLPRGQTQRHIPGAPILAEGECGWGRKPCVASVSRWDLGDGTWSLLASPTWSPRPCLHPGLQSQPPAPRSPLLLSDILTLKKAVCLSSPGYSPCSRTHTHTHTHTQGRLHPGTCIHWDRLSL